MEKSMSKTQHLTFLAVLSAIIILMTFTPLGYLRTGGLEITFIILPVAIGAVILKPVDSAILGGIFGITSFIQCFGMSAFGATLLSINWFLTLIVCLVPRVLAGWLGGLIFSALSKIDKTKIVSYIVTCLAVPLMNTLFFMSALVLCFFNTEFIQGVMSALGATNVLGFVVAFVGINGVIEAAVCFVAGTAISKALAVAMKKLTVRA
ncbi:MAG: ECF transporter S component [Clostridia bacterium]|nr:ECF transporter S component [Clostridia bacterium]